MIKIFVYGTLKSNSKRTILNYPNTQLLNTNVKIYGYTLFKSPIKNAPVMVKSANNFVIGEIYSVSNETIKELDFREGYKGKWYNFIFRWYKRIEIEGEIQAYIWNFKPLFLTHIGSNFDINDNTEG